MSVSVYKSESLFGRNVKIQDVATHDVLMMEESLFDDGYARFVTTGHDEQFNYTVRIYKYREGEEMVLEKTIFHDCYVYSAIHIDGLKSFVFFDDNGLLSFYKIPSYEKLNQHQLKSRAPIWRGINLSEEVIILNHNPFATQRGHMTMFDWKNCVETVFDMVHESYLWCMVKLVTKPWILVTIGGEDLGSDCKMRMWDWGKVALQKTCLEVHTNKVVFMESYVHSRTNIEKLFTLSSAPESMMVIWSTEGVPEKKYFGPKQEGFYSFLFLNNSLCLIGGQKGNLFSLDRSNNSAIVSHNNKKELESIKKVGKDKIDRLYCVGKKFGERTIVAMCRDSDMSVIKLNLKESMEELDEDERIKFMIEDTTALIQRIGLRFWFSFSFFIPLALMVE